MVDNRKSSLRVVTAGSHFDQVHLYARRAVPTRIRFHAWNFNLISFPNLRRGIKEGAKNFVRSCWWWNWDLRRQNQDFLRPFQNFGTIWDPRPEFRTLEQGLQEATSEVHKTQVLRRKKLSPDAASAWIRSLGRAWIDSVPEKWMLLLEMNWAPPEFSFAMEAFSSATSLNQAVPSFCCKCRICYKDQVSNKVTLIFEHPVQYFGTPLENVTLENVTIEHEDFKSEPLYVVCRFWPQ